MLAQSARFKVVKTGNILSEIRKLRVSSFIFGQELKSISVILTHSKLNKVVFSWKVEKSFGLHWLFDIFRYLIVFAGYLSILSIAESFNFTQFEIINYLIFLAFLILSKALSVILV